MLCRYTGFEASNERGRAQVAFLFEGSFDCSQIDVTHQPPVSNGYLGKKRFW